MLLTAALLFGVVAGFLLERHQDRKAFEQERREWTHERAALINREPIHPFSVAPVEDFNVLPTEGPDADEMFWDEVKS